MCQKIELEKVWHKKNAVKLMVVGFSFQLGAKNRYSRGEGKNRYVTVSQTAIMKTATVLARSHQGFNIFLISDYAHDWS